MIKVSGFRQDEGLSQETLFVEIDGGTDPVAAVD